MSLLKKQVFELVDRDFLPLERYISFALDVRPVVSLQTGRPYAWTSSVETAFKDPEPPPFEKFKISTKEGHVDGQGTDYWQDLVHEDETIRQVITWNESFVFKVPFIPSHYCSCLIVFVALEARQGLPQDYDLLGTLEEIGPCFSPHLFFQQEY